MHAFEFSIPTQIVFGPGTEARTGELAAGLGASRVLLVCGGQSARRSGLLDRVEQSLTQAGLICRVFAGIHPNPRLFQVREGIQAALEFGADLVLAVGGGSVIDAAKAIALGAAEPELTCSLPPYQIACGVVDIMMHTLDRYFTCVTGNLLTDEIAQGLLRTVIHCGTRALADPQDLQAMSELMWAGSLSHNGLTGLGAPKDFAVHQLGHELSARFDFAHGATLSAMWGSWAEYCMETDPARFAQYGVSVWGLDPAGGSQEELARQAIARTVDYFRSLGMPTCLTELGCGLQSEEELKELARRCTFYGARTIGAFRVLDEADILAIYRAANR